MKVERVKIHDIKESIRASKYPMATDIDKKSLMTCIRDFVFILIQL